MEWNAIFLLLFVFLWLLLLGCTAWRPSDYDTWIRVRGDHVAYHAVARSDPGEREAVVPPGPGPL